MTTHRHRKSDRPLDITLRPACADDLPILYAFESDPAWHGMAMLKPRSEEAFRRVWDRIVKDDPSDVTQRTILVGDTVCGTIGCRLLEDEWTFGYGLGANYWGRGIASRAARLFLEEATFRPLFATTAATNSASIRVLKKNGFVIESSQYSPESDRYLEGETLRLVLK